MNNYICSKFQWIDQIRCRYCIIHKKWNSIFMCNFCNSLNIRDIQFRISDCLSKNSSGLRGDFRLKSLRCIDFYISCRNTIYFQLIQKFHSSSI